MDDEIFGAEELAGEYARALLLLDLAQERLMSLGESKMVMDLLAMVDLCSARLEELSAQVAANIRARVK